LLLSISTWALGQETIEWRPPVHSGWYPMPLFLTNYSVEARMESYVGFVSSHIVYRDLIRPSDSISGTYDLTISSAINKIVDRNYLNGSFKVSPVSIMWKLNSGLQLNFNLQHYAIIQNYISKDLLEVLWYGNATYRGENKKLDASINFMRYYSLSMGVSWQLANAPMLTFGFSASLIMPTQVIYTFSNYGEIFTSLYIDTLRIRLNYEILQGDGLSPSPSGLAFSGGIAYQPITELFIYAYFSNLGFINFKQGTSLLKISSNSTYTGTALSNLTIKSLIYDTLNLDAVADSVKKLIKVDSLQPSKTTVPAPATIATGLSYQIDNSTHVWADLQLLKWRWYELSASFGLTRELKDWLIASLYYTYKFKYPYNLGVSIQMRFSPRFELRVASDNLLGTIAPKFAHSAHLFIGLRYMHTSYKHVSPKF
ncbi:MAG: hypothetical protein GXO48_03020, partial [Chlorobi bacterium]|nr:hypothetical protein [Chlorobiota bacterium]